MFVLSSMDGFMVMFLVIAFLFWLVQVTRVTLNFFKLLEIRYFYREALYITEVRVSYIEINISLLCIGNHAMASTIRD